MTNDPSTNEHPVGTVNAIGWRVGSFLIVLDYSLRFSTYSVILPPFYSLQAF